MVGDNLTDHYFNFNLSKYKLSLTIRPYTFIICNNSRISAKEKIMAKSNYYNLSPEKREKIYNALIQEFETNILSNSSVSNIVSISGISRGAFYLYFEDLEESFFTVMEMEVGEIHDQFMKLIEQEDGDFISTLKDYGNVLATMLFNEKKYKLYRNLYMYWNSDMEKKWANYIATNAQNPQKLISYLHFENVPLDMEVSKYINISIQKLIEVMFLEDWDKETFFKNYDRMMHWFQHGLFNEVKE